MDNKESAPTSGQVVFTWNNSTLPDGTYTVRATAVDVGGNCGKDEYTRTYTVDNTGISKINVTSVTSGTTHVSLVWEDVPEEDFDYFQVEQLKDGKFTKAGTVKDVLGMHVQNLNANTEYTFRVVGYDTLGNCGEASDEVTIKTQKDTTPPSAITDLKAEGKEGYATLTWTAPKEEDTAYYKIYRGEGETGEYKILVSNCTNSNYYDNTTNYGKTYRYKITSVDTVGNESEASNEALAQVKEDTKAPVIHSVSPTSNSTVGKNTEIKVLVYDNVKVSELTAEYKAEADNAWTKIETVTVNAREKLVSMKWNTENLTSNTYQVKVSAKDNNGNESEDFITTFQLDADAPEKTEVTAEKKNWEIGLSWKTSQAEDFDHYEVYRAVYTEESYTLVKKTTETAYADKSVTPETDYNYYVRTVDKYGNYSDSEVVTASAGSEDTIAPTAYASKDMSGVTGVELAFDGTGSKDNVRIMEYIWDMGDGTTITGAQPKHTYKKAGTYTVTLTVKDVKGNTDTAEISVTIYDPSTAGTIILQVTDQSNVPLSGAYVYVKDGSTGKSQTLKADAQGKITISGESGTYQFAAYKQDYLPAEKYVNLEQGKTVNATIMLEAGDVVVGDLKIKKMELSEMLEAGIDLTDPSNYNSYTYSLTLSFKESPIPVEYQITVVGDGSTKTTIVGTGGGEQPPQKAKDITFYPIKIEQETEEAAEEEIPLLAYLTDAGTISWMKEMFQVELGIINAAAPKFVLEDSHATLNLPEGVSLAELNAGSQTATIDLGDIPGQASTSAIWYIRGDASGTHELSADFEGTLMPFEKQVKATFKNEVTVQTGEGLKLIIHPEDAAYVGEAYYIQYELTNTSDRSFYNLRTTFGTYTLPGKFTSTKIIDEATGEVTVIEDRENNYYLPNAHKCKTIPDQLWEVKWKTIPEWQKDRSSITGND